MKRQLAFVLGGGGGRGALQAGALRALVEAGYTPDMLVGTSAGAVNATYLAITGVNLQGVAGLEKAWLEAAQLDLFPSNFLWLTLRSLFGRPTPAVYHRIQDFFISHGLKPELRFGDIKGVRLYLVATELNGGHPLVFGQNPNDTVLEGLLASTALPPWVRPIERPGQLLIDGGAVSTLPIEPAISQGAGEIIALDIKDFRYVPIDVQGFGPFMSKLLSTVENRQLELEMALAQAKGVKVHYVHLQWKEPVPLWDFRHAADLIAHGYEVMSAEIQRWQAERRPWWARWWKR